MSDPLAMAARRTAKEKMLADRSILALGIAHRGEGRIAMYVAAAAHPAAQQRYGKTIDIDGQEHPLEIFPSDEATVPLPRDVPGAFPISLDPNADVQELRVCTRPVVGGLSAAHARFEVGTLGMICRDAQLADVYYMLSNNHVFALLNQGTPGDPILQQAPEDGGQCPAAQIGKLSRFIPLDLTPGGSNLVDCALGYVPVAQCLPKIAWLGTVAAVRDRQTVEPGEAVWKTGRSSGLTSGTILAVHATVRLSYAVTGLGQYCVFFHDQILTSAMAAYGDSGSILVDSSSRGVGLLGGGSRFITVFNPLDEVFAQLNVTLV